MTDSNHNEDNARAINLPISFESPVPEELIVPEEILAPEETQEYKNKE